MNRTIKKYKLTKQTQEINGVTLYRIEAVKDFVCNFDLIQKGDEGGWIEKESNLSQDGNCWISDKAVVYGNAKVYENAKVYRNARVYRTAKVYGNARVYGNAKVYRNARVYGNARVYNCAEVRGDARVYRNAEVNGNAREYGSADVVLVFLLVTLSFLIYFVGVFSGWWKFY